MNTYHRVAILEKEKLNYDVVRFRLEKPDGYKFLPGQATELTMEGPESKGPGPFTFTALQTEPYLELMIKIYEERHGLTAALARIKRGEYVRITDPWDSFINKGPGTFLAGGAGITPFVALLRYLKSINNIGSSSLFFFNKTQDDIFLEQELQELLCNHYVNIVTREQNGLPKIKIDERFIETHHIDVTQPSYICGPPGFTEAFQNAFSRAGAKEEIINVSF
jgi:ferredoxin-NADP reductase